MEKKPTGSSRMNQFRDASSSEANINRHQTPESRCTTDAARSRWNLLRQVLRQKQVDSIEVQRVSVRRFSSFNLFSRTEVPLSESDDSADGQWTEYRSACFPQYSALLRNTLGPIQVEEVLTSFDNTGNVCVWPSEEVMAYYCLKNRHMFTGSSVCELGGGMTCLAGLMLAICADVKKVLLSDGNDKAIQNVRGVIEKNRQAGLFTCTDVSSRVVRWDSEVDVSAVEGGFDVIMCADCLFLDQYRACLVDALRRLLRPDGMVLVFAPTRGDTLAEFCRLAEKAGLFVCRYDNYDSIIWDLHMKMKREGKEAYDEKIHYPVLITLTHISNPRLL